MDRYRRPDRTYNAKFWTLVAEIIAGAIFLAGLLIWAYFEFGLWAY